MSKTKTKKLLYSFFLFIFIFQILLNFIKTESTSYSIEQESSLISFNNDIIYISKSNTNNEIKKLDSTVFVNHDSNITKNKELINYSDNSFILFGLNDNNYICYQIFTLKDSIILEEKVVTTNINIDDHNKYNIHCNSNNNYCIIALTNDNNIIFYQIINGEINNSNFNNYQVNNQINFIQCDSFKRNQIFCILGIYIIVMI